MTHKEVQLYKVILLSIPPVLLAISILFSQAPANSVFYPQGSSKMQQFFTSLFPQGWEFFTKPADSEMLSAYKISEHEHKNLSFGVNAEPSGYFGLSR